MSHFTGRKVHSVLRLINTPMRIYNKYQMMSYRSTLRKMNPNKTGKVGDDVTTAALFTERTQLLDLYALRLCMGCEICEET